MYLMQTVSTRPSSRLFPHVNDKSLDEITIMNSTEEIAKYSDNNSHYRSPTLARRATTELEDPQPEKPAKKDKKWSLGGLFRRRKKEIENESSSDEEVPTKKGFLQRRKQRKEDKRKKRSNKALGHFDHIVVTPLHHGSSYINNGTKDHDESGGILSDPTVGFPGYSTGSTLKIAGSNERISSRESLTKGRQELNLSRTSLGSGSLDSANKKSKREKVKARVEAMRGRMKNDSSSDEGSQRSTASSAAKFKSDDSLSKKDGNSSRKTRSARTERYNRRLTKEDEHVLNKEAEQEKHRSSKSDADTPKTRVQVNRWIVVDEMPKSPPIKPYIKPTLSYTPSAPLPQKPFIGVSTIPPSHNIHRSNSTMSDNQRNYFNSSHKLTNFHPNALRNQNDPMRNMQRSYMKNHHDKRGDFYSDQRSFSFDCNINRSPTPASEEQIIHVQFPIGKPIPKQRNPNLINNTQHFSNQSLQRITPPPPPPRDPQRKIFSNMQYENARPMQYENTRPMSYAFENGNQQRHIPSQPASIDRSSSVRSYNAPHIINQNINRAQSFGWQSNYRSNSEDHITQANPAFVHQITRPASATPDAPQQRFLKRYPTVDQYKYFAEKTPRSRKPIHIASVQMPDQTYLSDSQVVSRSYLAPKHPVHKASEFWKQKDMEELKRKSQLLETAKDKNDVKQKPTPVKKLDEKEVKNIGVLSIPFKTTDSVSSLSGNSDTSPLHAKSFFEQNNDASRPLSVVSEKTEVTDNSNTSKVKKEPPAPPLRRYSRQSSASSTENSWLNEDETEKKKHRSNNLEEALDELEAIYKSLRLGDEDLLDRAERRDVPPAVTEKLLTKMPDSYVSWAVPRGAQSDSGFNYDDNFDALRRKRLSRRSCVPDKINDDMAYRRLNKDRPPPLDINAAVSQVSYLLTSPVLGTGPTDENDNDTTVSGSEPDITLDDVVYRNIKHTNNTLKIADPQLPFGIPVGPISGASNSDYLHAVPENRTRSRFIPQKSPDIVKDDLAYRNLRKDQPGLAADDYLNNNNTKSDYLLKRKRAVRSISANIYNMMHKESLRATESENEFEKAQSLTDIADAMEIARQILKERQNKIKDKAAVSDTETKPMKSSLNCSNAPTSTETLTESRPNLHIESSPGKDKEAKQKLQTYISLPVTEETLNQKPPICPTPDRKSSKPTTKESTPNRNSPALEATPLDKNHLEDLLTALAIEAREASDKLGNDLKLLDEEESRKCSPRLSLSSSPAPEEIKQPPTLKSIDEKLSDIDAVSEHAKLCEKLLGCVVESTNLIGHTLPEVNERDEINLDEKVDDIPTEPVIYKSVANVIVTRKADVPAAPAPNADVHSESEHDYENIHKSEEEEISCASPFDEHKTKLLADFQELKKDLFSGDTNKKLDDSSDKTVDVNECTKSAPVDDAGNFQKLQDESCSEGGEVCSAVAYLASNLPTTECSMPNEMLLVPPEAFVSSAELIFRESCDSLKSTIQNYFPVPRIVDDSEHSSGFHTESQGSSTADSSLNPFFDFSDDLNLTQVQDIPFPSHNDSTFTTSDFSNNRSSNTAFKIFQDEADSDNIAVNEQINSSNKMLGFTVDNKISRNDMKFISVNYISENLDFVIPREAKTSRNEIEPISTGHSSNDSVKDQNSNKEQNFHNKNDFSNDHVDSKSAALDFTTPTVGNNIEKEPEPLTINYSTKELIDSRSEMLHFADSVEYRTSRQPESESLNVDYFLNEPINSTNKILAFTDPVGEKIPETHTEHLSQPNVSDPKDDKISKINEESLNTSYPQNESINFDSETLGFTDTLENDINQITESRDNDYSSKEQISSDGNIKSLKYLSSKQTSSKGEMVDIVGSLDGKHKGKEDGEKSQNSFQLHDSFKDGNGPSTSNASGSSFNPPASLSKAARRHSDDMDDHLHSDPTSWYRDPTTLALACSYGLTFIHQLAVIDLVTLLGLLLAIVTVFAAFVL